MVIDITIFLTMAIDNVYRINRSAVGPETKILLDSVLGFVAALFFLQFDLLKARPDDLIVWRGVQASMLLVDISAMCAFVGALSVQGAQTLLWMKLCAVGVAAIVKIAFLTNLGLRGQIKEKED